MKRVAKVWKYLTLFSLLLALLKIMGVNISWWMVITPFMIIPIMSVFVVVGFCLLLLITALD